jgi:hypothetical protein
MQAEEAALNVHQYENKIPSPFFPCSLDARVESLYIGQVSTPRWNPARDDLALMKVFAEGLGLGAISNT